MDLGTWIEKWNFWVLRSQNPPHRDCVGAPFFTSKDALGLPHVTLNPVNNRPGPFRSATFREIISMRWPSKRVGSDRDG